MLVRRMSEAPVEEVHRLSLRVLMDAGELGSRRFSATMVEVPAGAEQGLRSHEDAETIYVVQRGGGSLSVAGDTQELGPGDLVLIPPATDYRIANAGPEEFACISVCSPPVSVDELFRRDLGGDVDDFDEFDED